MRICRVCLASETIDRFTRIFESSLAMKIFLISSVKIIESAEAPAVICKSCEIEVYQAYNLRRKVQSSQDYFERKLSLLDFFVDNSFENLDIAYHIDDNKSEQDILYDELDPDETIEEYLEFPNETDEFIDAVMSADKESVPISNERKPAEDLSRSLSCQYCGLKLSRRQRLIQHERLHFLESAPKYTCDKCGKNFNQRFGLIPHFQKYHSYKPDKNKELWKCAICTNKILAPGNLEVHYHKIHKEFYTNDPRIMLETPKLILAKRKRIKNVQNNTINLRVKVGQKAKIFFPCEICGNTFTQSSRYQKHLNDLHGLREQEIPQSSSTIIDTSIREVEDKPKKIPCSTCGKVFATLNTCKIHEKIHSGLRFFCDLCGSSFSMKSYLTAHVQKVHLKLKRFKCNMCPKTFVHRELLNYHIKKHLNIRNYSCQFCQKTFVRKACVLIHERIHKNERPYSCKFCDRQFIHHSDYRRHENRHRNDISYRSFTTE